MPDKELQVREKQEAPGKVEATAAGSVFVPAVDIFESDNEITLLADMPGVSSDGVTIDLYEDQLTITGEVGAQGSEKGRYILREYETGKFQRRFSLSDRIDQSKIRASMKNGVLRLVMPKAEEARPRKIKVTAG